MADKNIPRPEELRTVRQTVRNVNREHREKLTRLERLALWITAHVGTMGFFLIIFTWTILWLGWNSLGPKNLRFDPLPGFITWLFISNMIQIFLMPLIMVGQNLQNRHAEALAESDYEVNIRSAKEVETILAHLESIERRLDQMQPKN